MVLTIVIVVLFVYGVMWAVVMFYLSMIDKNGLDMGLAGSGSPWKMSADKRQQLAEVGRARQHKQRLLTKRLWPTAAIAVIAAVALTVVAAA